MKLISHCYLCNKKIKYSRVKIGVSKEVTRELTGYPRSLLTTESNEGCFEKSSRKWFCNPCWDAFYNRNITVAVSGYFDPLHIGHIEYFKLAKELGNKLIVILNNDKQAKLKKGKPFMPVKERKKILESIKYVDKVFISIDKDSTVCKSLRKLKPFIFAKGGDRFIDEVPETKVCRELGINMVDGLGKKIQSSSDLIK